MQNDTKTIQDILGITFSWYDYSFFSLILLLSAFVGIYYGFYKKQETANDYIFGGKSMGVIPTALSLCANSHISGTTLLAVPSDVYKYGISYWITYVSAIFVILTSYKLFVPVFAKLQITSTFEYLKYRYDTKTRLLGSILYLISAILYLPIVIYVPALALAQATGMKLHLITILVCAICIFYTSIGGLKAVVYSDALQSIVIIGSLVVVFTLGVIKCGGLGNVWTTSYENDRLRLRLDFDFTKRDVLWAVTIGQFICWSSMGVSQVLIQKCLSLPSNNEVIKVLITFAIGLFIIGSLCNFNGLVMFTEYADCDPLESGILQKLDQLLPYYILDISRQLPGLAGLFIAGIFSAALSTMAAILNGLACTIFEDFVARHLPENTSERKISTILKLIVVIIGVMCTGMVFIVEKLGGMLALSNSLSGVTNGPILALFAGGMLIPTINAKGAYYGSLISMLVMSVVVFGSQWYQNSGYVTTPPLSSSIEGCSFLNTTSPHLKNIHANISSLHEVSDEVPYIFKVPFYWYGPMGLIVSLVSGVVIRALTKRRKPVHKDFLSPVIHRFLSRKDDDTTNVSEKLMDYNSFKRVEGESDRDIINNEKLLLLGISLFIKN